MNKASVRRLSIAGTAAIAIILAASPASQKIPYDRNLYKHWIDADADCQDTRQEVLIKYSLEPPELTQDGCRVRSGLWICPYTGASVTAPSKLDIDHLIPLAEAHRSGSAGWGSEQRLAFANDLFHEAALLPVTASANRSKGSRDPASWLPLNKQFHCEYVKSWVIIKATYNLSMDTEERDAISTVLMGCQ